MEILLLFAFAMLFAIAFNWGQPRLLSHFSGFAANFWGVTLLTAVSVMVLLIAVSWVFAEVGKEVVEVSA